MKRYVKLSKYRNFGLDKEQTIILNQSLKKEEIGDVVILIGPNNSGKSNVLDAIKETKDGADSRLIEKDKTILSFDSEDLKPLVTFGVKDNETCIELKVSVDNANFEMKVPPVVFDYERCLKEFQKWVSVFQTVYYLSRVDFQSYVDRLKTMPEKTQEQFLAVVNECLSVCKSRSRSYCDDIVNNQIKPMNGILNSFIFRDSADIQFQADSYMKKTYGIPFLPNIVDYKEKRLEQRDLETNVARLDQSLFFKSVFKAIGIDPNVIKNAYNQYERFRNKATLNKVKRTIDAKISKLSEEFNKMYFAEKDQYHFAIELDENTISFSMSRGKDEEPIIMDYQSTGFRWFFDLFFNFLSSNELGYGDIVVMDEPATHLHPQGQIELRRFLKEFAIRNGLTFILATHSPFLIDPDNFNELRLISMDNNRSSIFNLFSAIDVDDPDSLKPIKKSLTIDQNVFYDIDTTVVLVEGITDYSYLTMFKNILGIKNLAFLPFQGVGENENKQSVILQELCNLKFYKKALLLDGDRAGLAMKEKCNETALNDALCISDIFKDKKEIEDLFCAEDKEKYGALQEGKPDYKKASSSSLMKKMCKKSDFHEETLRNFEALFKRLID